MMSPEEYTRYNAIKAVAEFGKEMDVDEFRAARRVKLAWVEEIVKNYSSVIDYGSGSGWLKELCLELNIPCQGIDEIAEKGALSRATPADLLVSITVLEHMTPDEVTNFLNLCSERAKHLLLVTNNPKCMFSHYVLWDDITHYRLYTVDSIRALFAC